MIIGANVGLKSEEVLRFAERDALQVSKVLSRFGGTPSLNQVVLLSPSLSDVKRGVRSLKLGRGHLLIQTLLPLPPTLLL